MKKLWLLAILYVQFAHSQNVKERDATDTPVDFRNENVAVPDSTPDENKIYNNVNVGSEPQFPGGIPEFRKLFYSEFKLPESLKDTKGFIYLSFIVEKDGSLSDIKVIRDMGSGTGDEAIRVLKEMPKWIPGKLSGKEVRCEYKIPVVFKPAEHTEKK